MAVIQDEIRAAEPLTELVRARVTGSMRERLDTRLERTGMTESDAVRVAVAAWLDGETGEALLREAYVAGAEAGRSVTRVSFEDWLAEVKARAA